jgi:hypothetical protein
VPWLLRNVLLVCGLASFSHTHFDFLLFLTHGTRPEENDIGSTSWPQLGLYSSSDPEVLLKAKSRVAGVVCFLKFCFVPVALYSDGRQRHRSGGRVVVRTRPRRPEENTLCWISGWFEFFVC